MDSGSPATTSNIACSDDVISGNVNTHGGVSGLNVMYLNTRSVKSVNRKRNKLVQFANLVVESKCDVYALTETWLTNDIHDSELFPNGYCVYRKDREDTCVTDRAGGLLLAVAKQLESRRRHDLEPNDEILVCEIKPSKHKSIAFVLCYRPPSSDMNMFTGHTHDVLCTVFKEYEQVFLMGDFNMPKGNWAVNVPPTSANERGFYDVVNEFSLVQINTVPSNAIGNLLDLVFTSIPDKCSEVTHYDAEFDTDHTVLYFSVALRFAHRSSLNRTVFDYKLADWSKLQADLLNVGLSELINESFDIDFIWSIWLTTVENAIDACIPQRVIKDGNAPAWIDGEVRHLRNVKHSAWVKAKKTNNPAHWSTFRLIRNKLRACIRSKYDSFVRNLGESIVRNSKRFWSFVKSKTNSGSVPNTVRYVNNDVTNIASDPQSKADMFNAYFHTLFTSRESGSIMPAINEKMNTGLSNMVFTTEMVFKELSQLDVNKSCGPDNLSPQVLKKCAVQLAPSLTKLFNLCMSKSVLPSQWKSANIIPVFKKGDKDDVCNYRPISLLCIVSKVMERCIVNHVFDIVKPDIYPLQHGFVKGRSCCSQLLEFYHDVGACLDTGGQTDIIYLDFSKAFDSVSHSLLIHKLRSFGFCGKLLSWLQCYLNGRHHRVVIEGKASSWLSVLSGVPQGSILGPLLFLLFINDMPLSVSRSTMALFADDAKCSRMIKDVNDCLILQSDLDKLTDWSNMWLMVFNPSKCKVMSICRSQRKISHNYMLNGVILEHVDSFKDLGVTVSSNLNWNTHVNNIIAKANRVNGLIKRTVGYHAPTNVTLNLYQSLSRSTLEYCSPVWSPQSSGEIFRIEQLQRSMTRYIMHYPTDLNYKERCEQLEILPLSYRREIADMTFLYKCFFKLNDFDIHTFIDLYEQDTGRRTGNCGLLLRMPKVRTETFKMSYFNRISMEWNMLPLLVRSSPSLRIFKNRLLEHYYDRFSDVFTVDSSCTYRTTCSCQLCGCARNSGYLNC